VYRESEQEVVVQNDHGGRFEGVGGRCWGTGRESWVDKTVRVMSSVEVESTCISSSRISEKKKKEE